MANEELTKDKDFIIKMYNEGWHIIDIANKYGVNDTTIQRRLKKWGYEVKRRSGYRQRKSKYNMKARRFSPELLAQRAINTKYNDDPEHGIKYVKFENTTGILSRPIIG